jgi:putative protein-disulfide isomerase
MFIINQVLTIKTCKIVPFFSSGKCNAIRGFNYPFHNINHAIVELFTTKIFILNYTVKIINNFYKTSVNKQPKFKINLRILLMDKPILIYCYDAYCGWCYGFSPVIKKITEEYNKQFETEVLSGGMIIGEYVMPIIKIASFIKNSYKRIEDLTGIQFGQDFLWHINNPDKSDWMMNSQKPAIALCIFKEYHHTKQLEFASDLQYALNYEGRDLDDDEAYQHLLKKYAIHEEDFYIKLKSDEYKEKAYYEFTTCKQLQATSFPQVLLQIHETKFYLLAKGFTSYEELKKRIENVLKEIAKE